MGMRRASRHLAAMYSAGSLMVSASMMRRHAQLRRTRIHAATTIQAAWRCYVVRLKIMRMVQAAFRIQKWRRDAKVCRDTADFAVEVLVQGKLMREVYFFGHAQRIQRWYHKYGRRAVPIKRYLRAVIQIQTCFRSRRAAGEVETL